MAKRGIDVFRHRDYRAFLREFYQHQKEHSAGYSLRAFSRSAGLRSPNYLKLVMDGDRNLTSEMALRFAKACQLSGEEVDYFCELVAFNQSTSSQARERHYRQLRRFSRFRKAHQLDASEEAYHSQWYIPVVRELVVRPDFDEDPSWIAKALLPPISPAQARRALKVLCELGMLTRDRTGKLVQSEPLLETPEQPLGHHIANFHRSMIQHAGEAIDRVPREQREIASLTLCLSEAQLNELKQELVELRQSFLQRYQANAEASRVVQVNFQMFPLSRERKD